MKNKSLFLSLAIVLIWTGLPAAGDEPGFRIIAGRDGTVPGIVFSTFLAGRGEERGCRIVTDRAGAVYVAGFTTSSNFPPHEVYQPRQDIFVTKLSPDGKKLVYSAFFPIQAWEEDMTLALAVDAKGAAYLAGTTFTRLFPVKNAIQKTYGGQGDGFILKLGPSGKTIYSTFLGGSEEDRCLALEVGADGSAYIAGITESRNFPVKNAYIATKGGVSDGFVAKITPDGKSLVYSTFLGHDKNEGCTALALDASGAVVVAGWTDSHGFPLVKPLQGYGGGISDAFVAKLASDGKGLLFSTFLGGGHEDKATAAALDTHGNVYVGGMTRGGFPIKNGIQTWKNPNAEGFLSKLAADGRSLIYSTYLGGGGDDFIRDIAVDSSGKAIVVGQTNGFGFPVKDPMSALFKGTLDGFLSVIGPAGTGFLTSTYIGGFKEDACWGVSADKSGDVYLTGRTTSADFPIKSAYQSKHADKSDVFVMKLKLK